jgi:hypothetical protein
LADEFSEPGGAQFEFEGLIFVGLRGGDEAVRIGTVA